MDELDTADGSETIDGHALQASIDALEAMAKGLDADIANAPDVEAVQAIGRAQTDLRDRARALVGAQIRLLAGQVRIAAEHVDAAAVYAKDTIATMADWKKKIDCAARVVDFFGVVMTGDGAKILTAAVGLKSALG